MRSFGTVCDIILTRTKSENSRRLHFLFWQVDHQLSPFSNESHHQILPGTSPESEFSFRSLVPLMVCFGYYFATFFNLEGASCPKQNTLLTSRRTCVGMSTVFEYAINDWFTSGCFVIFLIPLFGYSEYFILATETCLKSIFISREE